MAYVQAAAANQGSIRGQRPRKIGKRQAAIRVNDLKDGLSTVEEKARYELGMVKPNEIYIQVSKR
jgi:cell division protein FtsB